MSPAMVAAALRTSAIVTGSVFPLVIAAPPSLRR
jgi:hypothetical protein